MSSAHHAPLRVAVIGAGLGAPPHFKSLADLADQVELAWVVARHPQRLAALDLPAGTRRSTRLDDVLEDASVQAALVLTPPNTHLELVRALAQAGKHVLVEKPLDVDLARSIALVETCEQHQVLLSVMLQHRLREASLVLKALLDAGELGDLVSASASVRWWRPQSYYDEPGRGTLARDGGGVLMTQAIHTLDLLLHLTGMPQAVTGQIATSPLHRMEAEDNATALLHYANGALAVVQATTAAWPGYPERIEINGTLGSATLQAGTLQVRLVNGGVRAVDAAAQGGGGADPMAFDHAAHRAVIQDFVRAVRSAGAPAITGRSALAVHRVIDAIVTSSKQARSIALAG